MNCGVLFRPDPVDETRSGVCWGAGASRAHLVTPYQYYRLPTGIFDVEGLLPRLPTTSDAAELINSAAIDPRAFQDDQSLQRIRITDNATWMYNCVAFSIGVTVPWAKLSYNVGLGGYRTDITESELRDAPRFAHTDENASLDEAEEEELHAHFRIILAGAV